MQKCVPLQVTKQPEHGRTSTTEEQKCLVSDKVLSYFLYLSSKFEVYVARFGTTINFLLTNTDLLTISIFFNKTN